MTQAPQETIDQTIDQTTNQETAIHTAGTCQGNPGPGGYAALIQAHTGQQLIRRGSEQQTSRLRMSIKALTQALEAVRETPGSKAPITIHSDSKYLSDAFGKQWVLKWRENGWKTGKGEAMDHPQDWENLMTLTQDLTIRWASLRGRNQVPGNNQADRLAEEMAESAAASGENAGRNLNIYVSGITGEETSAGGYAAIIESPQDNRETPREIPQEIPQENRVIRGGETGTSSSRMKLQAIILALRKVRENPGRVENPRVRVHTRSRYIVETMNQGWIQRWQQNGWRTNRGQEVKNQDLWKEILENIQDLEINWIWSKAHTTTPQAELCYQIAGEELRERQRPVPAT